MHLRPKGDNPFEIKIHIPHCICKYMHASFPMKVLPVCGLNKTKQTVFAKANSSRCMSESLEVAGTTTCSFSSWMLVLFSCWRQQSTKPVLVYYQKNKNEPCLSLYKDARRWATFTFFLDSADGCQSMQITENGEASRQNLFSEVVLVFGSKFEIVLFTLTYLRFNGCSEYENHLEWHVNRAKG